MSNAWRGVIPIYINNRDWLTTTRELVEYFAEISGTEVVIIDNASTFPPLLEWYDRGCRCKVIRLRQNHGCHAPWNSGAVLSPAMHRAWFGSDYYVVTDADLSLDGCPRDVLDVLVQGYESYADITKVGISLEINDLPADSISGNQAAEWEKRFWQNKRDDRFFDADIDTTFALYGTGVRCIGTCLRSDRPYTARHMPWYLTPGTLDEESRHYLTRATLGHWTRDMQKKLGTHFSTQPLNSPVAVWGIASSERERYSVGESISLEMEHCLLALLDAYRPMSVVETGCGISSFLFQRYAASIAGIRLAHFVSQRDGEPLRSHLEELNLHPEFVHLCPTVHDECDFSGLKLPDHQKYDVVLVNSASDARLRSSQSVLNFLRGRATPDSIWILAETTRAWDPSIITAIKKWFGTEHFFDFEVRDSSFPGRKNRILVPGTLQPDACGVLEKMRGASRIR